MGITKNKITSGNSGSIKAGAYLKKGGKATKMMAGGTGYKKGGMTKSKKK